MINSIFVDRVWYDNNFIIFVEYELPYWIYGDFTILINVEYHVNVLKKMFSIFLNEKQRNVELYNCLLIKYMYIYNLLQI